jgi:hypothetical protein
LALSNRPKLTLEVFQPRQRGIEGGDKNTSRSFSNSSVMIYDAAISDSCNQIVDMLFYWLEEKGTKGRATRT